MSVTSDLMSVTSGLYQCLIGYVGDIRIMPVTSGLCPWPLVYVRHSGLCPWPLARVRDLCLCPWPLAYVRDLWLMSVTSGLCPWPRNCHSHLDYVGDIRIMPVTSGLVVRDLWFSCPWPLACVFHQSAAVDRFVPSVAFTIVDSCCDEFRGQVSTVTLDGRLDPKVTLDDR